MQTVHGSFRIALGATAICSLVPILWHGGARQLRLLPGPLHCHGKRCSFGPSEARLNTHVRRRPVMHLPTPVRRLAVLEACSGCPLTRLELQGAVPLSGPVAEAVDTCCPQLSGLCLNHRAFPGPSKAVPGSEAATVYDYGCGQLLTLCGPRLRELQLLGVHCWHALSYMALQRCTALTGLVLEAGRPHDGILPGGQCLAW